MGARSQGAQLQGGGCVTLCSVAVARGLRLNEAHFHTSGLLNSVMALLSSLIKIPPAVVLVCFNFLYQQSRLISLLYKHIQSVFEPTEFMPCLADGPRLTP